MENTEIRAADGTPLRGLSAAEVKDRTAKGQVNVSKERNGKSYFEIVLTNLLTFFNVVWGVIAALMIALHSYSNLTFLFIIVPNVAIAMFLECRAKATVEKLSVTTDPHAKVLRGGELCEIPASQIVLGDILKIEIGQQVLSDAVVVEGLAEANESMLTGESNAIKKVKGDKLLAGSFLVSGAVYAEVCAVGKDNYVHTIEHAAKNFRKPTSDLFRDLNRLLRYIAIFMVPMAVAMFFSNYYAAGQDQHQALLKTSGSIVGMIPAGMYLLVTVTLTLSVVKLARKKTLVQDMYSIEMLARADVVCLDKTGTITDGTMCVSDLHPLGGQTPEELSHILAVIVGSMDSLNATSRALQDRFGRDESCKILDKTPFSSERKFCSVTVENLGTFCLGAPHFVNCPVSCETEGMIAAYASEGKRVLILSAHESPETVGVGIALVAITDRIRPSAKETIANFQNAGVSVRIISGDHAATVSAIAARVGVRNAEKYLSCEALTDEELKAKCDDYSVFGRVTPEQKVLLVKEFKKRGHTVAMTGDGVNDTLALKESNCAIAMAEGSEMACKVSQIVLLNSDFSTLPDVVLEGRRCINNVRMSATLYIMKTILTILLSLYTVITVTLYPFEPRNNVLLEMFVIGISSVLLALEPNHDRIKGSFISSVIRRSLPSAVALFLPILVLLLYFTGKPGETELRNTLCMVAMTLCGYVNLAVLCYPYTRWRFNVVLAMGLLLLCAVPVSVFIFGDMFGFLILQGHTLLTAIVSFGSMLLAGIIHFTAPFVKKAVIKIAALR
ncbi:MAG: HAD-IC family P-type ATPase [Clostridia bacterium]|nr:HAD-IC family P-type ATPase [Clostridia bacterium]